MHTSTQPQVLPTKRITITNFAYELQDTRPLSNFDQHKEITGDKCAFSSCLDIIHYQTIIPYNNTLTTQLIYTLCNSSGNIAVSLCAHDWKRGMQLSMCGAQPVLGTLLNVR